MGKTLYDKYLATLRTQATQWIAQDVLTIMEDKDNALFIYRDKASFISISGLPPTPTSTGTVTLTFTERQYYETLHPSLRSR